MSNLRKLAKGRECMVRFIGLCNHDNTTTVLAHLRLQGLSGIGLKANDVFGAWCCSVCHQHADTNHDDGTKAQFYEGIFRTQNQLIKEGHIKC